MRSHAKPWWRCEAIDFPPPTNVIKVGPKDWQWVALSPTIPIATSFDNGLTWNINPAYWW